MSEKATAPGGAAVPETSDTPDVPVGVPVHVPDEPVYFDRLVEPGRPETPVSHMDDFPEPSPPLSSPGIPMSFITDPDPASPEPAPTDLASVTDMSPSEAPELAEGQDSLPGRAIPRRDSEGPQLVFSSLPEVVYWDHMTPPQVVNNDDVKIAMPSENDGPEVLPKGYTIQPDIYDEETIVSKRPRWINRGRNKLILGVIAIIVVLVIAGIATGAAVGVIINKNNNNSQQQQSGGANPTGAGGGSGGGGGGGGGGPGGPPGPAPTAPVAPTAPTGPAPPGLPTRTGFGIPTSFPAPIGGQVQQSSCTGTTCPQMIASAQYATSGTSTIFVFARGLDSAIWYRQAENMAWKDGWKSLGGNFASQPAAVSIREGRVDVFAVSSDKTARLKTFQNGVWDGDWTNLGGTTGSPPVVCSLYPGNLNVVMIDGSRNVVRKNTSDGHAWEPAIDKWDSLGGPAGSSADVACTSTLQGGMRIDVAALGSGSTPSLNSKRWTSTAAAWDKDWGNGFGLMKGDPTVVSTSDQTDYLGIGVDETVWHRTWTARDGWGKAESLGGKFQSAVSAFATGGSRLDIFAVGTDARLYHKARLMGVWGTSWEDLGGYFHSAPKAVVTDVATGAVTIFGVGPNGKIIHCNFMVGAGYNWGPQQWYSDEGDMTANWLRL